MTVHRMHWSIEQQGKEGYEITLTRDIEVWRVEVLSGWRPFGLTVLETADVAGPRLVSPREEKDAKF